VIAAPYLLLGTGIGIALCVLCCFSRVAVAVITLGIAVLTVRAAADGAYVAATTFGLEAGAFGWLGVSLLRMFAAGAARGAAPEATTGAEAARRRVPA
jgi:hypothetical protein